MMFPTKWENLPIWGTGKLINPQLSDAKCLIRSIFRNLDVAFGPNIVQPWNIAMRVCLFLRDPPF